MTRSEGAFYMKRDPDLVHRILLAIEAKTSTAPQPIKLESANEQDVLNHLASLHEEGHISGPTPHRSSSTGEFDLVPVGDLTLPGRKLLAELNDKEAVEFAAGDEDAPGGTADHVALTGRVTAMAAGTGQFNVTGNDAALTVTRAPTTVIGKAVLSNKVALQLAALSLRASLDAKLEQMRADRSNSEDPAQYEDLRRRVDEFLIASMSNDETPVVATTLSLADGLRNWWTRDHSSICNRVLNMGLFAGGLAICGMAGALGPVSVPIVATLIGGKDVASSLESCVKMLAKRD
jgi:hypothetical protein